MSNAGTGQVTKAFMGIRLTVQTALPNDPYFRAQDFFPLADTHGFTVGSEPSNDLVLHHPTVALRHCRIYAQGPYNYVECLGSQSGTFLNDQRLNSSSPTPLRDGNRIRVGHHVITVGIGQSAFLPSQQNLDDATYDLHSSELADESSNPLLEIVSGPKQGVTMEVEAYKDIVVGRGRSCVLVLPDTAISREHLVIKRDWSGCTLLDLGSRNGVLLNGEPVTPNKEIELQDGDQIGLGHHLIVYREPLASMIPSPASMPAAGDDDRTLPPTSLTPEMQAVAARIKQEREAQAAVRASRQSAKKKPATSADKASPVSKTLRGENEMEEPTSGFYHAPAEDMTAAMRRHAATRRTPQADSASSSQSPQAAARKTPKKPRKKASGRWKKRLIWSMLGLSLLILGLVLVLHFRV